VGGETNNTLRKEFAMTEEKVRVEEFEISSDEVVAKIKELARRKDG
jgi:hypothetical protein